MVMGLLSPRGSQITTTTVAGTCYAMIFSESDVTCFGLLLLLLQGIGSWSAAWASRVDVV